MGKQRFISVVAIMFLVLAVLVQPVITYGHDDGGGDSGGCSSEEDSEHDSGEDHSKGGESGKGHYGKGKGGNGGSHSDVSESEEEEGGSGRSEDKKGGVNKGGPTDKEGSGKGGSGKGGKKDTVGGEITLNVKVEGLPEDLEEVDVTLTREDDPTTKSVELEDGKGTVTFISEASGDCFLEGEDVEGYETPFTEISLTGVDKEIEATLTYIPGQFDVTGVEIKTQDPDIDMNNLEIIAGYSDLQLVAEIIPGNANNQNVTWESSDEDIAIVSDGGLVSGISAGEVEITVITEDGGFTDSCEVTVLEIVDLSDITENAVKNEIVNLPKYVGAELSNGSYSDVSVTWKDELGNEVDSIFQVPINNPHTTYTFYGHVDETDEIATFTIIVDQSAPPAIPVVGIALNENTLTLIQEKTFDLDPIFTPENPTNQSVTWTSSKETVATVDENGVVYGVAPGTATITVTSVDGGLKAYCMVSVILEAEVAYIFPTLADGEFGEHFDNLGEVYINVENLIVKLNKDFEEIGQEFPTEGIEYHVKVEDNRNLLGDGTVTIFGDGIVTYGEEIEENEFNLYDVTEFNATESYSSRYFVYMSQEDNYPKDDEKTLFTNFMGGTATPTIPIDNVSVEVEMLGGNWSSSEGIVFLLCRELDLEEIGVDDISEMTWEHYYLGDTSKLPYIDPDRPHKPVGISLDDFLNGFCDEVKMKGVVNSEGKVEWRQPKETLKLGGYFLIEVTPPGYLDNLNNPNPESDDGELLKEVHLMRDGSIYRYITNIYIGDETGRGL